jgi:hypothetical protein
MINGLPGLKRFYKFVIEFGILIKRSFLSSYIIYHIIYPCNKGKTKYLNYSQITINKFTLIGKVSI